MENGGCDLNKKAFAWRDTLADPLVGAMAQRQLDGAGAIVVTKLDLVAPERRIRFSSMADEALAVQERDGVMVFIGFIDAAVEAALRDGIVQCSAVASMVAPTSTVE